MDTPTASAPAQNEPQLVPFGVAISMARNPGVKISRKSWNDRLFVFLSIVRLADGIANSACFCIKDNNDFIQAGWLPSQRDLLADDWYVITPIA